MAITAEVSRGKNKGTKLGPHQYGDGSFVVSLTRFQIDQIKLESIDEVKHYLRRGYGLRMSNPYSDIKSPSLIISSKIDF